MAQLVKKQLINSAAFKGNKNEFPTVLEGANLVLLSKGEKKLET